MDNTQQLVEWMEHNGYSNRTLAEALDLSYDLLYKVTTGERQPSEGFRWRFAKRFGFDVAERLFGADAPRDLAAEAA